MNEFEERLRAAGWDDELLHAEPGTLRYLTTKELRAYLDTPAELPEYRALAEESGVARGIYVGEDPEWDGHEGFKVVDGRRPFEVQSSWELPRLAVRSVAEPENARALMGLDRLLSYGPPEPWDTLPAHFPGAPSLNQDLYNERAGVYVASRLTHEGHQVLDCHFHVTPEKAARAWEISQTEQEDPRHLTIATVEEAFGRPCVRIDRDDPADWELLSLLERNLSTPGIGWVEDKDIVATLARAASEPRREGNLRAIKEYAEAVGRAVADYPEGLMYGTVAERRLGPAREAIGRVRTASDARDISWSDIEAISSCGGWLRIAMNEANLELARGDSKLTDLGASGTKERLRAFMGHECDVHLAQPFNWAYLDEAKARADELGDRMPMTRDEMSFWYTATADRVYSAATREPGGEGWSLVLTGGMGYLSKESQEAILGGWRADAFCRLDSAKAQFGLDSALDAWARHPGDPNWIADVPGWFDELTYDEEFLPEDFEPGGEFFEDRGSDPDEVVAHTAADGRKAEEPQRDSKAQDGPAKPTGVTP